MNSFDFEDFVTTSLKKNTMRRQYLVTHSKANMTKFSSRESFPEVPVNLFFLSGKVTVQHWACCLEEHGNTSGKHMCVTLSGLKRCNPVKNHLMSNHQIVMKFFESDETYYTSY